MGLSAIASTANLSKLVPSAISNIPIIANTTNLVSMAKKDSERIRKQLPNGEKETGVKSVIDEAKPVAAQPTDPTKEVVSETPLGDAYRRGGSTNLEEWSSDQIEGQPATKPRILGEYEEEVLASISIVLESGTGQTELQNYLTDTIMVPEKPGNSQKKYSTDKNIIDMYSRFFLQRVAEQQTEKYQIVETFTAFYSFFYGKRPTIYNFSGMLMNDRHHKWSNDMMFFYDNYFRGTRAAELGAQAVVYYDGRLVTGFILGMNMQQVADLDKGVAFSLDMLVISHVPVHYSKDIASVIESKTKELASAKAKLEQDLAAMNKNVPSLKRNNTMDAVQKGGTAKSAAKNAKKKVVPTNTMQQKVAANALKLKKG
jgi:hypothetical protein